MPVVPPAPATFSTMIGWPSVFCIYSPTMRAIVSVGPPAANGTIMVIGLSGYSAAAGARWPRRANSASAMRRDMGSLGSSIDVGRAVSTCVHGGDVHLRGLLASRHAPCPRQSILTKRGQQGIGARERWRRGRAHWPLQG